jgi:hypothetical protein
MDFAAMNGHLNVVKWLLKNKPEWCTFKSIKLAKRDGRLEVEKYLNENIRSLIDHRANYDGSDSDSDNDDSESWWWHASDSDSDAN